MKSVLRIMGWKQHEPQDPSSQSTDDDPSSKLSPVGSPRAGDPDVVGDRQSPTSSHVDVSSLPPSYEHATGCQ